MLFLGRNNKEYFKEFGTKLEMNDPMDVNKHQWSWSQHLKKKNFFYLRPVKL